MPLKLRTCKHGCTDECLACYDEEIDWLRERCALYERAVAEAEVILGGEYAMHYGPFFDLVEKAREPRPNAVLSGAATEVKSKRDA